MNKNNDNPLAAVRAAGEAAPQDQAEQAPVVASLSDWQLTCAQRKFIESLLHDDNGDEPR